MREVLTQMMQATIGPLISCFWSATQETCSIYSLTEHLGKGSQNRFFLQWSAQRIGRNSTLVGSRRLTRFQLVVVPFAVAPQGLGLYQEDEC